MPLNYQSSMIHFTSYSNLHTLHTTQLLPIGKKKAWDFFSNPRNLILITPPEMGMEITSQMTEKIVEGQIITYKMRILKFIKVNWITEIRHLQEGIFFTDEQRFGPYKFWQHRHIFNEKGKNVEMTDIVTYILPFGFIGRLANLLFVKKELKKIFEFRRAQITALFTK